MLPSTRCGIFPPFVRLCLAELFTPPALGRNRLASRAGHDLRLFPGEHEGLFGLRAPQRGVPGEGLAGLYLLPGIRGGYDLARSVAGHAALVMVPPAVGEALFGVEAAAVAEGFVEGAAGTGCLLPHTPEDGVAGPLPAAHLGIRLLELDHPGEVGVEPPTLGTDDQHRAASQSASAWDRVPVEPHPALRGREEHGREHAASAARRGEVSRRLELVRVRP